jgi:hypothetical protein
MEPGGLKMEELLEVSGEGVITMEVTTEDAVTTEVSEIVAAEDDGPDSEDVIAMKLARAVQDSEMVPDSLVSSDSETVATEDVMPDSEDVIAMKLARAMQDSEMVPDSETDAAEDSDMVLCVRCGTSHGAADSKACYEARREARRCGRCGLLHEDYDLVAWILHDFGHFDCKIYIPDLDKLVMRGETIIPPEHIMNKLDEEYNMKRQKKMKEDAKISEVHCLIHSIKHACIN